jgi:tetratricopeptide (TPR) repeat protein
MAVLCVAIPGGLVIQPAAGTAPSTPSDGFGDVGAAGIETTASLVAGLDHLPLVVSPLGTGNDQAAVEGYRSATVRDRSGLEAMYTVSVEGLVIGTEDVDLFNEMLRLLFEEPRDIAAEVTGTRALLQLATTSLRDDPANADRLNNMAVALWLYGAVRAIDSTDDDDWFLQHAVVRLFEAGTAAFPDHRGLLLNLAFLRSATPGWGVTGAEEAGALLARNPADVTARALLASIQSRQGEAPEGIEQALITLRPLLDDPATAALGEALSGDAHLAAASIRRFEAPAQARREANLALESYDRAAMLSGDPEIQAGRARALELLGDVAGAAEAQAAAAAGRRSIDLDLDLARLRYRTGDVAGLRTLADAAVDEVLGGWDPRLATLRFVVIPALASERVPEDRGFLGWSVGSAADHLPLSPVEEHTEGGPGVVVIETLPLEFPGEDHELAVGLAPRTAWRLALSGAILQGDPAGAEQLDAAWETSLPWNSFWRNYVDAARIVSDGPTAFELADDPLDALELAAEAFARAGRYGEAAALCRSVGELACAGANALRAGEAGAAEELRRAFETTVAAGEPGPPISDLRMLVAAGAEQAGDLATAEAFLRDVAGADDAGLLRVRAAIRLGDLRLDASDPSAAASWYELALAAVDANGLATIADYHRDGAIALEQRGLAQVARNNHGVALLRALQRDDGTAPSCTVETVRSRCESALADFSAAAASDPANAVYRMNAGWAARLLDRPDEARTALETAVGLDSGLFPAFNDLGVLLARSGDSTGAHAAFEAALAADPTYDLASWNLGILALRDVPAGFLEAQARLAAAIRQDPSLRTAPLDFRTDERTYRFGFEAPLPQAEGLSLGRTYSVGAVVLAGVTSIAALAQLQATLFGHAVETASSGTRAWLERQGRRARWRWRQRALRRRLPSALRSWLPWLGIVVVLAIVSGWQAAQASPSAVVGAVALALFATVLALVAHGIGHALGARSVGGRLIPAAWTPGALVALLFLPVQAASGPFLAERLRLPAGGRARAWQFHLAGPLGNLALGVVAYATFLLEPMPVLRLIAQVQLAAIAYTLLPVRPLDGWWIQRQHPRLLVALGFGAIGAGTAFALGIL